MSQSPLSRAIRDLERELGLVLFVRTTRRVELTAAGSVLLERSRQALIEIDGAIADARRAVGPDSGVLAIGYGPFSGAVVTRIAEETAASGAGFTLRLQEEVTPDSLAVEGAVDTGWTSHQRHAKQVSNSDSTPCRKRSRRAVDVRWTPGRPTVVAFAKKRS
jgi:DNA-binding transcriptional LysR family regulator